MLVTGLQEWRVKFQKSESLLILKVTWFLFFLYKKNKNKQTKKLTEKPLKTKNKPKLPNPNKQILCLWFTFQRWNSWGEGEFLGRVGDPEKDWESTTHKDFFHSVTFILSDSPSREVASCRMSLFALPPQLGTVQNPLSLLPNRCCCSEGLCPILGVRFLHSICSTAGASHRRGI